MNRRIAVLLVLAVLGTAGANDGDARRHRRSTRHRHRLMRDLH